jgi:LuxR family maltose regulon positive regulatory protein
LLSQKKPSEADALLEGVVGSTKQTGRVRDQITALILRTLAQAHLGNPQKARSFLVQALQMAAPEGYLRAFLDEWTPPDEAHPLRALLEETRSAAPEFIAKLLYT